MATFADNRTASDILEFISRFSSHGVLKANDVARFVLRLIGEDSHYGPGGITFKWVRQRLKFYTNVATNPFSCEALPALLEQLCFVWLEPSVVKNILNHGAKAQSRNSASVSNGPSQALVRMHGVAANYLNTDRTHVMSNGMQNSCEWS